MQTYLYIFTRLPPAAADPKGKCSGRVGSRDGRGRGPAKSIPTKMLEKPYRHEYNNGKNRLAKGYKWFPGKPAAEVSYKKKLTYRSVHVLSNMRVLQSNARAPDF